MASHYDQWAEIYDSVYSYVTEDIPFYVEEARRSGAPVLELGCGTGRVTIPIAQSGVDVVGLDSSPAMLRVARRKASRQGPLPGKLALKRGDMRGFAFEQRFSLVIIPFRGFLALLSVEDQTRTLECVRRHLEPDGRLIFNIFVPDLGTLAQEGDVAYHLRDVTDPQTGKRLVLWNQTWCDQFNQLLNTRIIVEELDDHGVVVRRVYRDFQLRYAYRWELHHLLTSAGFQVLGLYGDFERTPFDEHSTEMVWVAGRRDGTKSSL